MFKLIDQSLLSTKAGHNYWKYSICSDTLSGHIEWITENIENSKDDYLYIQDPKSWNDLSNALNIEDCPVLKIRS